MVDGVGVHAFDNRNVVSEFSSVREQFADVAPAFAVLGELVLCRRDRTWPGGWSWW